MVSVLFTTEVMGDDNMDKLESKVTGSSFVLMRHFLILSLIFLIRKDL